MGDIERTSMPCEQNRAARRARLLAGYLLNGKRGAVYLRRMIRADIDRFAELGAKQYASDLTAMLERFNTTFPDGAGTA